LIRNAYLLAPSYHEAEQIAKFLDHETAKIDLLIAKQQALIALLKEKRQAVISHAVTKGLNPNAKMKDSGVEWLGQVPEGWKVARIKFSITTFEQGWSPQCDAELRDEGGYGVLKVGCVNSGVFDPNEHKALPASLEPRRQYSLKNGDLLISRANTRNLVGKTALVECDDDQMLLCDKLYRLRFNTNVHSGFIRDYLLSDAGRSQIELDATGASSSMVNIGQDCVKEMPIALPPLKEQTFIVAEVVKRLGQLETLNADAAKAIELMQERRTALISAAVTGKIDVRDFAPEAQKV
jgi:type I restriction enzyme S subunit